MSDGKESVSWLHLRVFSTATDE